MDSATIGTQWVSGKASDSSWKDLVFRGKAPDFEFLGLRPEQKLPQCSFIRGINCYVFPKGSGDILFFPVRLSVCLSVCLSVRPSV